MVGKKAAQLHGYMKYKVIYADPPWKQRGGRKLEGYKKDTFIVSDNSPQKLYYPTMSVEEICSLPVKDLADSNCALFMWVTNKYLPDARRVVESWGFKYSATIVWAKNKHGGGLGGNVKISTEFLIYATKGKSVCKKPIQQSWINVKKEYVNGYPKGSKKPTFFANLIKEHFEGPYIELFARDKKEGFDSWGNEIKNDIEL